MLSVGSCRGAASKALVVLSVAVISSCSVQSQYHLVSNLPSCQYSGVSYASVPRQLYQEVPQQVVSSSQLQVGSALGAQTLEASQQIRSFQGIPENAQQALGLDRAGSQQEIALSQQVRTNVYASPQQPDAGARYVYAANQQYAPESQQQSYTESNQILPEPQRYVAPSPSAAEVPAVDSSSSSQSAYGSQRFCASQRVCASPEQVTATQKVYSVPPQGYASQRVYVVPRSAGGREFAEPSSGPLLYPRFKHTFGLGRQCSKGGKRPIMTIRPAGKAFFIECN